MLDGELWLGRGRFEALSGAVRRTQPDDTEWRQLRYMVFDMPQAPGGFAQRHALLPALGQRLQHPGLQVVQQVKLPSPAALQQHLAAVVAAGGEGLMLQRADAPYRTGRSGTLLKFKPLHDADARVLAHVPGRGKHTGRLGALCVRTEAGVEFLIGTGLSDAQRENAPAPGAMVTFTHRGHTANGAPRFSRPDPGFSAFVREIRSSATSRGKTLISGRLPRKGVPAMPLISTPINLPPRETVAEFTFLHLPFDAMRRHYASCVQAGLVRRSLLDAGHLERSLDAAEQLTLGPLARRN